MLMWKTWDWSKEKRKASDPKPKGETVVMFSKSLLKREGGKDA